MIIQAELKCKQTECEADPCAVDIQPAEPAKTAGAMSSLRWSYVLIPIGVVAAAGAGVGGALLVKHRRENADEEETEE